MSARRAFQRFKCPKRFCLHFFNALIIPILRFRYGSVVLEVDTAPRASSGVSPSTASSASDVAFACVTSWASASREVMSWVSRNLQTIDSASSYATKSFKKSRTFMFSSVIGSVDDDSARYRCRSRRLPPPRFCLVPRLRLDRRRDVRLVRGIGSCNRQIIFFLPLLWQGRTWTTTLMPSLGGRPR